MAEDNKKLNVGKTNFPMKAGLSTLEPTILAKNPWISTSNVGSIVLHDGPPYANGSIHVGHAYNKILKVVYSRFLNLVNKTKTHFVCGWDCHGLPIELAVEKTKEYSKDIDGFRQYAKKQITAQKDQFKRIGVVVEHQYETMSDEFEDIELKAFQKLVKQGLVFVKNRPVHWCWSCQTSLAEHELEYKTVTDNSIHVLFPSKTEKEQSFLIWTTTPWTLKANKGIVINKNLTYVVAYLPELNKNVIVSEYFAKNTLKLERHQYQSLDTNILLGQPYFDCFGESSEKRLVFHADYVTETVGTGLVHIAPSCGKEDYVSYVNGYPEKPVDKYTDEKGLVGNLFYKKANKVFVEELKTLNRVWDEKQTSHDYPHCWRCGNPTIQRATRQVFLDYSSKMDLVLSEANKITFYPSNSKNRFLSFLDSRTEWCLSRQRKWGVPIPSFNCLDCKKENQFDLVVEKVEQWRDENYKPRCIRCKSQNVTKHEDILDVWFDSGLTYNLLENKRSNYVIEGSDQHRGWFQSSHILSCLLQNKTCFEHIVSHGFVLDENGSKMSKSLGNVVDPITVANQQGAEILYLWALSQKVGKDVVIGKQILNVQGNFYRKIRNTLRYFLSNLYDFDPKENVNIEPNQQEIEKLINLEETFHDSFGTFEFVKFTTALAVYLNEISTGYIDSSKSALYESEPNSLERRTIQKTYWIILGVLVEMLEVFLPFTIHEFKTYQEKELIK